jgi:hypothetical protein
LTERAVQLAMRLKVETYTKLLGLTERFIWIARLQELSLHKLWTKIVIASDQIGRDYDHSAFMNEVEHFDGLEIATVSAQISGIVARDCSESFHRTEALLSKPIKPEGRPSADDRRR